MEGERERSLRPDIWEDWEKWEESLPSKGGREGRKRGGREGSRRGGRERERERDGGSKGQWDREGGR